jgi:hypothetical protein
MARNRTGVPRSSTHQPSPRSISNSVFRESLDIPFFVALSREAKYVRCQKQSYTALFWLTVITTGSRVSPFCEDDARSDTEELIHLL